MPCFQQERPSFNVKLRALRHPIRATDDVFNPGDRVFYKRDGSHKRLGPGKVLYQDGKVVFVRHGGVYVRLSTKRLIKDVDLKSDDVVVDQRDTNPNMSYLCYNLKATAM